MLAVPTPSPTKFYRSLYDVDRTKPSPFAWKPSAKHLRRYERRMGLVESFFNTMATLHEGRTDIFYRTPLSCPAHAYGQLVRRLPLVWALLCRRHPLLGAYVETLTPDGSLLDPQEAASKRHAGEAAEDGSSSFEPHFLFDLPDSASDLLENASRRLIWLSNEWAEDEELVTSHTSTSAGPTRSDAVVAWLDRYVWNGERRFLRQDKPFGLARLIVVPPSVSSSLDDRASLDLILCTAHCISDGLSISSLAGELLQILTSPQLPVEFPALAFENDAAIVVPGASCAQYKTVTPALKQALLTGLFDTQRPSGSFDVQSENDAMDHAHFLSLLPASIEATYPELLPLASQAAKAEDSLSPSRLAKLRWFWTIRRVICQIRAAKAEQAVLSDFKANRDDKSVKEPWWGAQTRWSVVRLSKEETSALTQVAKRRGVRVGSLLYAVAACALNTLENQYAAPGSRDPEPNSTIMGFPFSVRRFLDAVAPADVLQPTGAQDPLMPPSSLGVRLSFNGVGLPPAKLFSLEPEQASGGKALTAFQVAQLWQTARQVQRQFDSIFAEPRFMHADGFLMGLEREMRFRKNGVKDVFQVFKNDEEEQKEPEGVAGEDERKPGLTKKNMQGPGSSLNFSMVGLLDPVLPSELDLPLASAQGSEGKLEVKEDLLFGVRTRAGEAFGTSFTFRGQLNLELGHDTVVWETDKVLQYLELMKHIVQAIVAFEQRR
ncbi:hypothetical protein NDA11_002215 [Ustilago hordei]|uniref:Uncharacterized protein n=1 Tax=Ustilago hordei TaxID=120017 RepID=I2G6N6_USTHO|nr:uncharacterized protein UHO2_02255 [Ustilago hordei]KAJ1585626.1 hypothetical protein NDA12_000168 [Ustilago hordei]KAJ1589418.1 hypothetical protein NDA15_005202 [Ustilago hordei]KAJ1590733.1 hypothetical protein NDA11_002215 [Ustilago hordei]KAJ1600438.1 hypothetical protein NDA14_000290 [Ustilago hordei]UTT93006.1 hypothetical protein NDA17_003309 [Ustilago hordei]